MSDGGDGDDAVGEVLDDGVALDEEAYFVAAQLGWRNVKSGLVSVNRWQL